MPLINAGAPMFTAKELAAAEERGRRAGIEEAAKKAEERCYNHGPRPVQWCEYCVLAERIRHLAPRDSGPVCDCEASLWGGGHLASCAAYPRGDRK